MLNGVNLYLIGMMGTGKTTIGQKLAEALEYQFIDTDEVIEQATQQTIANIFADSGEDIFRQLETATLSQLSPRTHKVIATGGGIVLRKENWGFLRHGVILWIDAPVEVLHQRLSNDSSRPLLQDTNLLSKLTSLSEDRRSLYQQADLHLTIGADDSVEQITQRAIAAIAEAVETKRLLDEQLNQLNDETPFQLDQN